MADTACRPGWLTVAPPAGLYQTCSSAQEVAARAQAAIQMLDRSVTIHPDRRGGVPVLAGTRFAVSQLLAELAEGSRSLDAIADDFDLDAAQAKEFLEGLSMYLDCPQRR